MKRCDALLDGGKCKHGHVVTGACYLAKSEKRNVLPYCMKEDLSDGLAEMVNKIAAEKTGREMNEHYDILRSGVEAWNQWRQENPAAIPDLRGANLSDAYLRGANLRDADLRGANLRGANLRGADLTGADLSGADLSGADLTGANLRCADLWCADLWWADITGANLTDADLTGAIYADGGVIATQEEK